MTNKPRIKIRAGNIQASVFSNEGKDSKGNKFFYDSIVIQRSYKNEKGDWVNEQISVRKNDLIKIHAVLNELMSKVLIGSDDKESTE